MAGQYDIFIEQGADYIMTFRWRDPFGVAINLTGYTARMQFRKSKSDTVVLLSATTENLYITLGGVLGTVNLAIPNTVTAAFTFVRALYDIELISPAGVVTRWLEGGVEVNPEVTR